MKSFRSILNTINETQTINEYSERDLKFSQTDFTDAFKSLFDAVKESIESATEIQDNWPIKEKILSQFIEDAKRYKSSLDRLNGLIKNNKFNPEKL